MNEELIKRIKQICKAKNISLGEIADRLGIKNTSLSQSLSRDMRISRVYEIADILGVQVGELFTTPVVKVEIDGKEYPVKDSVVIRIKRV